MCVLSCDCRLNDIVNLVCMNWKEMVCKLLLLPKIALNAYISLDKCAVTQQRYKGNLTISTQHLKTIQSLQEL